MLFILISAKCFCGSLKKYRGLPNKKTNRLNNGKATWEFLKRIKHKEKNLKETEDEQKNVWHRVSVVLYAIQGFMLKSQAYF